MDVRELTSLAKQVQLSYTQARDSNSKVQLHVTSLHAQNPVIHSLEKQGMKSWKLHLHEESVWDVFATEARPACFEAVGFGVFLAWSWHEVERCTCWLIRGASTGSSSSNPAVD